MPDITLRQLSPYKWEIPVGAVPGMRVHGLIYADEALMREIRGDKSAQQVANGATLPGIVGASMAMPDMHFGYGLPIGGVVATDTQSGGIISPGGTGYDINCGVRLASTNLTREDLGKREKLRKLVDALFSKVPSGVGSKGPIKLNSKELKQVLTKGAKWAVDRGLGEPSDLEHTEEGGSMKGADPSEVSDRALQRGAPQQGTLGSGNHFVEVQYVEEIYDEKTAGAFGIRPGQITVMVHSGSRGFGHQVCTDHLEVMNRAVSKYGIDLPDRQLACAPFNSPEGQSYWRAMKCAANYAWANRQCLMHLVREALQDFFSIGPTDLGFRLVYDVAHNIVKLERHTVDGREMELAVHRKGATRAFPPGHPDVPAAYRPYGQPVIIPGDMGTCSYLLRGTETGMEETFGSTCHGAGRVLSRKAAIRSSKGRAIHRELEDQGIYARAAGKMSLKEEMPDAYKDVSQVVEVVHQAGIAAKVAKMRPLCVVKG
ncbi:MAG: RtcB family protein [bacterium]|nr:MAG: RtcB family protein [bacterium]